MASVDTHPSSPFQVFETWYAAAEASSLHWALQPQYATLSTCSSDGQLSSRIVGANVRTERCAFAFCTNVEDRMAKDLAKNATACLLFYWAVPSVRQVKVEGTVEVMPNKEAASIFNGYPRELQISIAVQCEVAEQKDTFTGSKAELDKTREAIASKYADQSVPVPVPGEWIGYYLVPTRIEFNDGALYLGSDNFIYTTTNEETQWSLRLKL